VGSEPGEEYETASETSSKLNTRKRKHEDHPDKDSGLGSSSGTIRISESESGTLTSRQGSFQVSGSPSSLSDQEYLDATSDPGISSGSASPLLKVETLELRHHKPRTYRSIVTEIFNGKLVSSVKCLTCDRISKTTETFQDLSLPIPSQDALASIRQRPAPTGNEEEDGWIYWMWKWVSSWFYGPEVTLQDCLAFFFSEDELKGDNMYSCEKCEKLRNGLKFSQVTQLPDTLCVHLKRFRHDFAFSSKISTRVVFPLTGLDLAPWVHKDCVSTQTVYDLTGVICHHGTAGGGHYTSYCYNYQTRAWYHFDDSIVTQVEPATVMNAEAYVLFYRKNSDHVQTILRQLSSLQREPNVSLVNYFVSNPWLVKLHNMAEPGQIDNSSVLCRHGGVLPQRIDTADSLCTPLPPTAWRILYERFGGSAAVTCLKPCQICLATARAEERQRQFELTEFQLLRDQDKVDVSGSGDSYLLVTSWFTTWEAWVLGKAREPPGPINNRSLFIQRGNSFTLRPNIDHFKLSEDLWSLFLSLYSGGPEVVLRSGGGIRVSSPRPAQIASIAARLRARCNETCRVSESN
jgi:ubiquitin carboxyl-terminal hydrolase 20/33